MTEKTKNAGTICYLRLGDAARLAMISRNGLDLAIAKGWLRVIKTPDDYPAIDARDAISLKQRIWGF